MAPIHQVVVEGLDGWHDEENCYKAIVYANTERGGECQVECGEYKFRAVHPDDGVADTWKVKVLVYQGAQQGRPIWRSDLRSADDVYELVMAKLKEKDVAKFEQSMWEDLESTFTPVESSRIQTDGTTQ